MAKTHHLRFLIRNQTDDLIVEVRKQVSDRIAEHLSDAEGSAARDGFFWFDTVDGKSIAINLVDVQAVRLLWDLAELPSDSSRYQGALSVYLRGRLEPIHALPGDYVDVFDLFTNLELGPETVPFPTVIDEDGEPIFFNAREIVLAIAPAGELQGAGRRIAIEDGLEDEA